METDNILVSVIIPVYNAEKYLAECLDSVRNQTLKLIEIICVDDGSSDRTLDILQEYARLDERFIILHQENLYAGVARNHGLGHARGKYVAFWDADDVFESPMLESMYYIAEKESADVVVCGYSTVSVNSGDIIEYENPLYVYGLNQTPQTNCFTGKEICLNIFQDVAGWPWDKLFRREYIVANNIEFQALRTSNDGLFVYKALILANKIAAVRNSFVLHRINDRTSLENTRDRSWNCAFEMLYAIAAQMKKMGCYDMYKQSFLNHVIFFLIWNLETFNKWETYQAFFNKIKSEYLEEFNIADYKSTYFYDQELYKKYSMIQTCSPEQYLMIQTRDLKEKSLIYINEIKRKQWRFPYEKIQQGSRLVLYGAGSAGRDMYRQAVQNDYCKVVMWIDKNLQNEKIYDKVICSVDCLESAIYDCILIAISNKSISKAVKNMLETLHISSDKIIEMF